jgi:predicted RNA binding protein YcfA (HicA-like mRNA interferase family)
MRDGHAASTRNARGNRTDRGLVVGMLVHLQAGAGRNMDAARANGRSLPCRLSQSVYSYILRCGPVSINTPMKSQDIIGALKADGWGQVAQKDSHVQFKHPTKPSRVTVPPPKKNIPLGTLRSIEKQAGLKLT